MIQITNVKIYEDLSKNELLNMIIKKYKIKKQDILDWKISKKSIDARKKDSVHYVYSICLTLKNENNYKHLNKVNRETKLPKINLSYSKSKQPIIIGAGPSGLFAALTFVQNGIKPIIIEQGEPVELRKKTVDNFLNTGNLNNFSNVQFGEGGAGTFSDGKLTTGIHSPFCKKVLEEFVYFGAPEEILYITKPHIGTDKLIHIIKNIRNFIISKGGKFYFNTKVTNFNIKNNSLTSISYIDVYDNNTIEKTLKTDGVILAIGHSSRDTFNTLYKKGIYMEQKNFSVGLRIEHLQEMINISQYGTKTKLNLPTADYKLAYHDPNGRSCYTFCMCPGGVVMASSSENNTIVTNGMSYFSRAGSNANSAILVNVTPDDFNNNHPLAGINFQKNLEQSAFTLGGSNYNAPIQKVGDFINNKISTSIGNVKPTYQPGAKLSNLHDILPHFVSDTLIKGIKYFDTKLKGFANSDALLTGVETRSSSPVRIKRNELFTSNICGIYPCGEGAGYAGGIMSAAVDGIKCAISILENQ